MGKVRACFSIALILLLVTLIGCGGGSESVSLRGSKPAMGGNSALPDLPAPSELRKAKVVTSGVFRYGSQFINTLPNQRVFANGNLLTFTTAWTGAGLGGAAYAIFAFDSTGFSTDDTLHLAWDTPGADVGDLWVGLANFPRDRWDWFAGPGTGALPYDALKYADNGLVYAVVLCLGGDVWKLKSARISAEAPPVVLSVSPLSCIQGTPTTFTAVLDGTAASYSWDFGGGATPNTSTAGTPTVTPLTAGAYPATLTVANSYGSDLYGFTLTVQLAKTPPVADLAGNPLNGAAPLTVDFDASASFDPDNGGAPGAGIVKYEWDYTDDGTYDFDSGADATVSHNYPAQGIYTCRVRVTDDEGVTATDTVVITAGPSLEHAVSGTATMEDAGGLAGVNLTLTPGGYSDTSGASGAFSIAGVPDGGYTLTPTLAGWTFSPATLPVTVSGGDVAGNNFTATAPPVANLTGDPLIGGVPLTVNFDASASNDPDNGGAAGVGITKYEWDWEDDGTYDFDSGADATVSHTYQSQGAYVCGVRVTDNESATATATVTVTVGSATGYIASGYVKSEFESGLYGVTVSFTGGLASVTTDGSGFWYRDGIPNGSYTATVSMAPYTFSPPNHGFTINSGNVTVPDSIGALGLNPDTLYAIPLATTATVGQPVDIVVATGQPPHALAFMSSVGVTVETAGSYAPFTFNIGNTGGSRDDTDGYWALLGPPPPPNNSYQDLGDFIMPGGATDIGGGRHRYNFAIIPNGPFTTPASISSGAILFNFAFSFSAPGTYHLGFQASDGSLDQTYYTDQNGDNFYWGTLDNSYTITVN